MGKRKGRASFGEKRHFHQALKLKRCSEKLTDSDNIPENRIPDPFRSRETCPIDNKKPETWNLSSSTRVHSPAWRNPEPSHARVNSAQARASEIKSNVDETMMHLKKLNQMYARKFLINSIGRTSYIFKRRVKTASNRSLNSYFC